MPTRRISRIVPFYSTFPIREQAPKGSEWDFKLNHVYTIALLNFSMNEDAFDKEKIRHHVQLCDTATHKVFYDKLEYIYVEISKFNKPWKNWIRSTRSGSMH